MEIIKSFQNDTHITIQGTHEEPLFKASDIGEILELSNIRKNIADFNANERVSLRVTTLGGEQEVTFLTEKGLYKILFKSRKAIAEKFQDWVCDVIKEIRLSGIYELEKQIKDTIIQKEQNLLKNFSKKTINYIGYADKETGILKFGWTDDIESRLEDHKKTYRPDFTFEYIYESQYAREIEKQIKQKLKKYIISKEYLRKNRIELIQLDSKFTIKEVDKIIQEIKKEVESNEIDRDKNTIIDQLKLELIEKDKKIQELEQNIKKTNGQHLITKEPSKEQMIPEEIIQEYASEKFEYSDKYKVAIVQIQEDFNKWYLEKYKIDLDLTANGKDTKNVIKKNLTEKISQITNLKTIKLNIYDKVKNIELTKYIGFVGIRIKEEKQYMYPLKIYEKFISDRLQITNNEKHKISKRHMCEEFIKWLECNNYELNVTTIGKSRFSLVFMNEIIEVIKCLTKVIFDDKLITKDYRGSFLGLTFT